MTAPNPADVLVARAADRLALIVMRSDAAAALELCRQLHDLRGEVVVALRTDSAPKAQGRAMPARFPGRCSVCATGIRVGEPIHFDAERRQATHERCA